MQALSPSESLRLADALPDVPESCIALHALRTGRGRAYAIASAQAGKAAIVDAPLTPGDLLAFGDDVRNLRDLLRNLSGWTCVEVIPEIAEELAAGLAADMNLPIVQTRDLYFTLTEAVAAPPHPHVRLLTPDDADLYARCAPLFDDDPTAARQNVIEGPVAAAVVDGQVVCSVEANVRTARYANFCVETLPAYRGRGLCTATAALAAHAVQAMDLIPLWSCSEENAASQRVARKLGFNSVSHCVYLIPQRSIPAV